MIHAPNSGVAPLLSNLLSRSVKKLAPGVLSGTLLLVAGC